MGTDMIDAKSTCSEQSNVQSTDNSGALKRSKTTTPKYRSSCGRSESSRKRILDANADNNNSSVNDNVNANVRQAESEYDSCSE